MNTRTIAMGVMLLALAVLTGCATTAPKAPPRVEVEYEKPSLTLEEGTPQVQEKHGVRVSVEPSAFSEEKMYKLEYESKYTLLVVEGKRNFEQRIIPFYKITPDGVIFNVRVSNTLDHVLRLAGTVVAIQVDGDMVDIDPSGLEKVHGSFVLPGKEAKYTIRGPKIASLPKNCTVTFSLYEIVTKTDAAGNATERTSFDWQYAYTAETIAKSEEVRVGRGVATPEAIAAEEKVVGRWEDLP